MEYFSGVMVKERYGVLGGIRNTGKAKGVRKTVRESATSSPDSASRLDNRNANTKLCSHLAWWDLHWLQRDVLRGRDVAENDMVHLPDCVAQSTRSVCWLLPQTGHALPYAACPEKMIKGHIACILIH